MIPEFKFPKNYEEILKDYPAIKDINGKTCLTKTIKVFLESNLSEPTSPSTPLTHRVTPLPTTDELLKWIVKYKDDIISEAKVALLDDASDILNLITNISEEESTNASIDRELLETLYNIFHKYIGFKVSEINNTPKLSIIGKFNDLTIEYRRRNGSGSNELYNKSLNLIKFYGFMTS